MRCPRHALLLGATLVLASSRTEAAPFSASSFNNPPRAGYGHSLLHVSTPASPTGGATTHRLSPLDQFLVDLDLGADGVFGTGDIFRFGSDVALPAAVIGHDHDGDFVIDGGVLTVGNPWTGVFPGLSHRLSGHLDFHLTESGVSGRFLFASAVHGGSPFNGVGFDPLRHTFAFYLWGRDPELSLGTDLGIRGRIVPEPATVLLSLVGAGGAALARLRRRGARAVGSP